MQDVKAQLKEFMAERGLSQVQLAIKARVSQSTVSRVLRGDSAERYSRARHRLLRYAGIRESMMIHPTDDGIKRVVKSFNQIWDGSDAHAAAVANVIRSLAGLRPMTKRRKGTSDERQRKSFKTAP